MRATVVVAALAGCVSIEPDTGTWQPVGEVEGALAVEVGPAPGARPALPGGRLRVATWNVHFAADPDALAAAIRAAPQLAAADVLLVQEIEAHDGEPTTRARRLAEALDMTWIYAPARAIDGGTHGIALLSRLPLELAAVRRLPYFDQPIRARERNALEAEVVVGGRRIRIVDVHLDVRLGPVDRIRQLDPAARDQPEPAILGGDFNSNPWAWLDATVPLAGTEAIVGQDQAAVLDDYFADTGWTGAIAPGVNTMRVPVVSIRLDNLYARGLPIVAAGVEYVDGSDHWPVWFDLSMF
jgi:endonuclease/exonuclease/phosphatase family metal-dependent hydrolase